MSESRQIIYADERGARSELEAKLRDIEAVSDLMINVQTNHMDGDDVQKYGGLIWRLTGEAQEAFNEVFPGRGENGNG